MDKPKYELDQRVFHVKLGMWYYVWGVRRNPNNTFIFDLMEQTVGDVEALGGDQLKGVLDKRMRDICESNLESEAENHDRRRNFAIVELSRLGYKWVVKKDGTSHTNVDPMLRNDDDPVIEDKSDG